MGVCSSRLLVTVIVIPADILSSLSPSLSLSLSPHPSIPGGLPGLFWELKSVDSFPTILSLTHSPSLTPSTAGLMFLQSLGADEKREAERGSVYIHMWCVCMCVWGTCAGTKRKRRGMCVFHITWGLESRLCCHTSGRQCQNNISFCSTMEKSPKIIQHIQNIDTCHVIQSGLEITKHRIKGVFLGTGNIADKTCYLKLFFFFTTMRR